MTGKALRCLTGIVKTVLLALYLFAFYQLLLIPAILDWSSFGVLLTLFSIVLLVLCIPAGKRLATSVLGFTFLLTLTALDNIRDYPALKYFLSSVFIFLIMLIVGKLLGRFSLRRYLTVFLVALVLTSSYDLSQARFWTEFAVKWESPVLYNKLATVDYFPVRLANVDNDPMDEIITQENLAQAKQEQDEIASDGMKHSILQPESNHYAVYKWDGRTFTALSPQRYDLHKLEAALPVDYVGYPFYDTSLQINNRQIVEKMEPVFDRAALVEQLTRFGRFPFTMLAMDQESLETRMKSEQTLEKHPSGEIGGNLIPGPPEEQISIDDTLTVKSGNKVVGTLDRSQVPDLGISEILTGDVDHDGTDELLLNAETSRILKLTGDGKWTTLWASPEEPNSKVRFQGFRFEDFAPLGKDKTPEIIALAKSNVRDNPSRYMTGYVYTNNALQQKWRVFAGLINLRAGDVDGDGQNELIGYMYRQQKVFVLKKHNLPVVPALYAVTGLLILLGFTRQWRQKRSGGGEIV